MLPPLRHRLRGWAYIIAFIGAICVAVAVPYVIAADKALRPPIDETLVSLELPAGVSLAGLQEARIVEVIDGDTVDVTVNGKHDRIRYFGVDTPERGDRCFREATDRNQQLVGKTVLLLPDTRNTDQYGRSLRYIFMADGTSIDATLVAEGFGKAWTRDGRYRDQIVALESEAQSAHRGCLWG